MKILITGGTGFIGSHLVNSLVERELELVILKRSTSDSWRIEESLDHVTCYNVDEISLQDIVKREKADFVLHLATNQRRQGDTIAQIIDSNVTFPSVLVEEAVQNGLQGFINTDTSASGDHSLYASTKKAFLSVLNHFHTKNGLPVINLQLEYVYGPKDNDSKFVPYLIKSILCEESIDASPGTQKRDFIYVQDAADAYIKAMELVKQMDNQFFSLAIGSGESISLKEFAETVARLSSKRTRINWGALDFRKGDIFESKADITAAKEILGWNPNHNLKQGLEKTINWFRECI
ncbi:NAD-dependent epimerase/dehydratase family protein [bacterium]|nr:NAD-dependent epimerase/dehydratase family protein [bacterium]